MSPSTTRSPGIDVAETRSTAPLTAVPAHESPVVSFVIVTYGTGPIVVNTIASIVDTIADAGPPFEVVVVDNEHPRAPHRARNELALSTSGVRVLTPGCNLGFGAGCELGALYSSGRILAFVNPDVVFGPGWLAPLLDGLDAGASIVAPRFANPNGTVQEAGSVLHVDASTSPIIDDEAVVADYASAACWLIERDEHERLGGFDPAFHPAYYEDVDLALRAARLGTGLRVISDSTIVHHRGTGAHESSQRPDTSNQRNEVLVRHPSIRWRQPPRPAALR